MGRLEGRTAFVTGAARGIGKAIATVLAEEGAAVVIADILAANATQTANELAAAGHNAHGVAIDVTKRETAEAALRDAVAALGPVSVLVNNAGVIGNHAGSSAVTNEDFDACYEVNLKGVWNVCGVFVPHFREQGGGRIVNIASTGGRQGRAGMPHYCASKAGVISITQTLAIDLGRSNINVNAVCPGLLWTDMWRHIESMISGAEDPEIIEQRRIFGPIAAQNALRRELTPEDIGRAVAFFASDDARNITGQALNVDGGVDFD
jgi:NAD(P)-dependent dehydrogenase (short-subunit alcohol dehydrogenase family)